MVVTQRLRLQSKGNCDTIDISAEVQRALNKSGLRAGIVTVFVAGSTAAVTTLEFESGLISDFRAVWERVAPQGIPYQHDLRWGDGNGYSHLRASLLGPSLVIPFAEGALALGTWQQVVLVDFDNRARSREVVLQIIGE